VEELIETCRTLEREGIGLLLVEQNLGMATAVAQRILVMVSGRIALETTATELTGDVEAQRRYLGVEPLAAPA
jgi:branched-chain amino acid transport system ATP-binding protein